MNMTEETAKTKWCPMVRLAVYAGDGAVTINRDPRVDVASDCKCIASDCMFWRWAGYKEIPGTTATDGSMNDEAHGYCGLAGKP